jgi:site-specific DNA-methyltransferase (adenine-specific)
VKVGPYETGVVYQGDCLEWLDIIPENSIDTICTDPPYGIRFMGKAWDGADIERQIETQTGGERPASPALAAGKHDRSCEAHVAFQRWSEEWARAALRVAKPGAILLAFGGTRTFHRLACAIEDAGWEIRDTMMWVYGSGFPKSLNLKGEWDGWGTALKPAWEPIIVAMKPLDGTFAENAERWGVAGLWIDGGRIEAPEGVTSGGRPTGSNNPCFMSKKNDPREDRTPPHPAGRWPSNLIHDGSEEVVGELPDQKSGGTPFHRSGMGYHGADGQEAVAGNHGDSGSAARFFYCAKASRRERNAGCEGMEGRAKKEVYGDGLNSATKMDPKMHTPEGVAARPLSPNHHPTVKPLALMRYLVRLTKTPTGGLVLDPFAGSGTTGMACKIEGREFIGFEKEAEYVEIANRRIPAAFDALEPDPGPRVKDLPGQGMLFNPSEKGF